MPINKTYGFWKDVQKRNIAPNEYSAIWLGLFERKTNLWTVAKSYSRNTKYTVIIKTDNIPYDMKSLSSFVQLAKEKPAIAPKIKASNVLVLDPSNS